ncbi:MAG: sugar phosphate isomerase/epimerase [Opitutales bacterium]|nr:sugar phosphate isomerase/epimerase [Opitutales bacterium]
MIDRRKFLSQMVSAAALAGLSPAISACRCACNSSRKPFKMGVADWSLLKGGDPSAFDVAKEIGLDGVQVSMNFEPENPVWGTPEKIAALKSAMARTNLECASTAAVCGKNPFIKYGTVVDYIKDACKASAQLGAKDMLVPFYGKGSLLDTSTMRIKEEYFKPVVERLKLIAPVAEKYGVTIGMENSLNAEDDIRIIEAVGSPAIKVYFDIMNFQYYGFETVPEMKKLKGYINQIHLKDIGHKLDSNSGMPRDMRACFDTILEIGFDGWLVFETHGYNPKKLGPVEGLLKHNLEYVKNSVLFS